MMRLLAVISTAGSLLLGATTTAVAADPPVTLTGTLRLGEPGQKPYSAIKPAAEWNGTLALDLDFNGWNPAQREWFLSHGYAIGGVARTQNVSAYEIHQYIDRNWGTYQPPAASPQSAGAGGASKEIASNERVLVRDVTWSAGSPRPLSHTDETVLVFLQGGTLKVTRADGTTTTITHKTGDVVVEPKGAGDTREAVGTPVRTVVVALHDKVVPPLANPSGLPEAFPRPGSKKVLENARIAVWDYNFVPGEASPMHFHSRDVVTIYTDDGAVTSTTPQGDTTVNEHFPGEIRFNPRNRTHTEKLTRGKVHIIVVELK